MRRALVILAASLLGCATSGSGGRPAPAPTASNVGGPEIVHHGKTYKIDRAEAVSRYARGAKCGGADSPAVLIGDPDQKNEMQIGKERVVTYGFRFPESTLLIRCRADRVEITRTLK